MAKILLVEDDRSLSELYRGVLVGEGFEVLVAETGDAGLILARERNPDVIVLDMMLPGGMNGFDVLEWLRKDDKLKKIPVLVLTNLDTEEKIAKEVGAKGYLVKANVTPGEVVEKIKKLL